MTIGYYIAKCTQCGRYADKNETVWGRWWFVGAKSERAGDTGPTLCSASCVRKWAATLKDEDAEPDVLKP